MKYGKIHIPLPAEFGEERAALSDLLEKGEIDEPLYRLKLRDLHRNVGLFIARTNAVTIGGKRHRKKNSISTARSEYTKSKTLELAKLVSESIDDHMAKTSSQPFGVKVLDEAPASESETEAAAAQ